MSADELASSHGSRSPTWPKSLTIAVRPRGRITSVYESTTITTVTLVYPLESYDGLIEFYDDVLVGWACSRTEGDGSRNTEYSLNSSTVVVNLCVDTERDGFDIDATCVAITQVS